MSGLSKGARAAIYFNMSLHLHHRPVLRVLHSSATRELTNVFAIKTTVENTNSSDPEMFR